MSAYKVQLLPYYEQSLQPASKWAAIVDVDGKSYGSIAATKEDAERRVVEWVNKLRSMHG